MTTLGILVLSPAQEQTYFTEMAKRATNSGISVHLFTPMNIDPLTLNISGMTFDPNKQEWTEDSFVIPNFIYDRSFYSDKDKLKKALPIVHWLKHNPDTQFLGFGLPDKWQIYQELKDHALLSYYIPKTYVATSPGFILQQLRSEHSCLLKPQSGSQGKGIISLQLVKNGVEIRTQRHKQDIVKIMSKKSTLTNWLKKLVTTHDYLLQPLLPLTNKQDQPFDIRILLQKNELGKWIERGRGLRCGQTNGLISNLHGGGQVSAYRPWLESLPHKEQIRIEDDIDTILSSLPSVLEEKFGSLFELGIDIGVSKDGAVWLLDINSKPGHQVILQTNPLLKDVIYEAPLAYLQYLQADPAVRR